MEHYVQRPPERRHERLGCDVYNGHCFIMALLCSLEFIRWSVLLSSQAICANQPQVYGKENCSLRQGYKAGLKSTLTAKPQSGDKPRRMSWTVHMAWRDIPKTGIPFIVNPRLMAVMNVINMQSSQKQCQCLPVLQTCDLQLVHVFLRRVWSTTYRTW